METDTTLRMTVFASLMAALTAAGAYLAVPVGPVPIVLQNLVVLLTGLLLGPGWGLTSVAVYLLAGAVGLPVFAGGTGGVARLVGPTGGYLAGYVPAVVAVGWISRWGRGRLGFDLAALILGASIVYALGVPWLKLVTGMPMDKAVSVGMLPFLPGDALKIAAAIPICRALRPVLGLTPLQPVAVHDFQHEKRPLR
jgi:biotin transport system substrate-specific component